MIYIVRARVALEAMIYAIDNLYNWDKDSLSIHGMNVLKIRVEVLKECFS